jgi:hypothetical protein
MDKRAGLDMGTYNKQNSLADTAAANVADPRQSMAMSQNRSAKMQQDWMDRNPGSTMSGDAFRTAQADMNRNAGLDAQTAYTQGQGAMGVGLANASGMYKQSPGTLSDAAQAHETANAADTKGYGALATALFADPNPTQTETVKRTNPDGTPVTP